MALSEFELIERYFASRGVQRPDVVLGVGDDGALLSVPHGMELVVSIDTFAEGVHFPQGTDPEAIGHKALAVNLSDLAAMGAEPAWATLALTLPRVDPDWMEAFCRGLFGLAERHGVQLVGGDTTRGALSITIEAHGFVPGGAALRRAAARPGDLIYVTGTLGDSGLALLALQEEVRLPARERAYVLERLNRPEPRIAHGQALRGIAHAAIDVSDGLAQDLGHVLRASGVGARIQVERLPLSEVMRSAFAAAGGWTIPLSSGDDYELCFTVADGRQAELERALGGCTPPCTWIGTIEQRPGLHLLMDDGSEVTAAGGYQHFDDG